MNKKKKREREEKAERRVGEEGEEIMQSKGKDLMVMLARKKDLFKEHDKKTPMLLLAYAFNTNPLLLISLILFSLFYRFLSDQANDE